MARSELLCVYCHRLPVDPATRPFCSERCRMADLGRWLSEDYRVADHDPEDALDDAPPPDDDTDD